MKIARVFLFLVTAAMVGVNAGCSSGEVVRQNAASNQPGNTISNKTVANATTTVNTNSNAVSDVANKVQSANSSETVAANRTTVTAPTAHKQTAPEDSTYSISLAGEAVETRVFNRHPVLAKVEKRMGSTKPSMTIFLRSGKMVSVDPKKVPQLKTALSSEILTAAGIANAPETADTPDRSPTKKNKAQN